LKLPILGRIDIIGAIIIAESMSSGVNTTQIDTHYHSILEHIKEYFLKIVLE